MVDDEDLEKLLAEARASGPPATPEEIWKISAEIADEVLRRLPSASVSTGVSQRVLDYIPPSPNPPIVITAVDGRFIVRFDEDGSWLEADGSRSRLESIIEGDKHVIAQMLIRHAGLEPDGGALERAARHELPDGPRRLLEPHPTGTWRDHVRLPGGQIWDSRTPASICRESASSRLFLVSFEQGSCTFAGPPGRLGRGPGRWGVESLRIGQPGLNFPADGGLPRVGDVLATVGEKFDSPGDHLDVADEYGGIRVWHPQRVIQVAPEGERNLRVWLARDNDVANDNLAVEELPSSLTQEFGGTSLLDGADTRVLYTEFLLNIFCPECGNRGKPIIYGLPGPDEPAYLALGGCIISADQPAYVCECGEECRDY